MKCFAIEEFGIDNLTASERPRPSPGEGEVLVRITAASLNYRDLMTVLGTYNPKLKRPLIPLSDGVGVVEQIGPGVTRFKAGDRVASCFFQNWLDGPPTRDTARSSLGGPLDGVLRQWAVFSEQGVTSLPSYLTDLEAATLPCAALTAWHALFEGPEPVQSGETVLLQGTGGVSTFALQFSVATGIEVIITSSSNQKLERARSMGAKHTINYRNTPEWDEEVRRLTNGRGVDRVIEVGGSDTLPRSLKAIRPAGTISVIGALSGGASTISPLPILMNSTRLQGIYVGSLSMFTRMLAALELQKLRPVIDRVFAWTEIKEALHYFESGSHFGKVCLLF